MSKNGSSTVQAFDLGSGSDGDSDPSPIAPFSGTETATDDAGDSVSETVTSGPTADGGFTLSVKISETYGDQTPADSGGGSDGSITTNGGSSTLTISFNVTPTSTVATLIEDDLDTYNDDETLTGPTGGGTRKASGKDNFHEDETVILNAYGTASESDATKSESSDSYKLSLSVDIGDGHTFTYGDSGKDKLTSDDSESDDTQGNDAETRDDEVNSTETTTLGESGNGLDETGTSTETVDFLDEGSDELGVYNETQATKNDGTDSFNRVVLQ